jgi:hypothetical protein
MIANIIPGNSLPALLLDEWVETKKTLHRYAQVIGKIKIKLMPYKNHWWHIPLYLNSRGLGTGPIPYKNKLLEINFDLCKHGLVITTNHNETEIIDLKDGLSVADFYKNVFTALGRSGIEVKIVDKPYELEPDTHFSKDREHCSYDKEYVTRFWKILSFTDAVLKEFSGRFTGKCSPVHIFWHSFDIAVTRFSGRKAPEMPGANKVNAEAYSHEVISAGFWVGDDNIKEPAFYSYTYPAPDGLTGEQLLPAGKTEWIQQNGSPMALYRYKDLLNEPDAKKALLDFLESSYLAGAKRANWDVPSLAAKKPY